VLGHSDKAGVLRHDCFVFPTLSKLFCFYFILLPSVPNMEGHNLNTSIIGPVHSLRG
jgi:hypothetical protein